VKTRAKQMHRQRGVAVITALLLTTLAITIVASLFWQQQVQVRSIENQRLQLQKQWILRGALDWAMLILREDLNNPTTVLTDPWAIPLADTQLDQYVENGRQDSEASEASLSGQIYDAQARFNLRNLADQGVLNPVEMASFRRLLVNLQLNPSLAKATADAIAAGQPKPPAQPGTPVTDSSKTRPMAIANVEDLLSVPGFTTDILAKLKDYVVVLPRMMPVNANTTTAEVLSARIDGLELSDAKALIASRDHVSFRDKADIETRLKDKQITIAPDKLDTRSDFFLVNGKVSLSRAALSIQALVERNVMMAPRIHWIREN
jgi:general secretion pathway protein K